MKRLVLICLLLVVASTVYAQVPTPPQSNQNLTNDPVFRQMVTERELLFKKLQDITEFQQFLQVERSIEQYVANHPQIQTKSEAPKPVSKK